MTRDSPARLADSRSESDSDLARQLEGLLVNFLNLKGGRGVASDPAAVPWHWQGRAAGRHLRPGQAVHHDADDSDPDSES